MNNTKRSDNSSNSQVTTMQASTMQAEATLNPRASGQVIDRIRTDSFSIPSPSISLIRNSEAFKSLTATHNVSSIVLWINRLSLFVIFFWFGFLKIVSLSPAETLVAHLHQITISSFISIKVFHVVLGIVECIIGIMWLMPSLTKYTFVLFMFQMSAAFLPLVLLPRDTWSHVLVLSLSGQYILKNLVLVACAYTIYKDCQPKGWRKCR